MRLFCCFALALAALIAADSRQDEARRRFEHGRELFEVHDDTGEPLVEAEAEFRRALQINPRFAPAVAYLGFLAAEREKPQEAERFFRRALELDGRCAEARVGLARIHFVARRFPEALRELRQAVTDQPQHRMALHELAMVLSAEYSRPTPEMWAEAIRCWQRLTHLDPQDRDAHHQVAQAFERQGQWADAEHHYREVLRIGQTSEDSDVWVYTVHSNVAQMLERQGKYREAIREYELQVAEEEAFGGEATEVKARIAALRRRVR